MQGMFLRLDVVDGSWFVLSWRNLFYDRTAHRFTMEDRFLKIKCGQLFIVFRVMLNTENCFRVIDI
jgi:hypothetical protein